MAADKNAKASAVHVDPSGAIEHRIPINTDDAAKVVNDAQQATEKEHKMTLWQGLKLYPKAIGWSILFSAAIIMEGYDVVLMGSFYAYPTFQEKYGDLQPDGSYQLSGAGESTYLTRCMLEKLTFCLVCFFDTYPGAT